MGWMVIEENRYLAVFSLVYKENIIFGDFYIALVFNRTKSTIPNPY